MPDWPNSKVTLLNPECRFRLDKLHVGLPEFSGSPLADIRPQDIGAFGELLPIHSTRFALSLRREVQSPVRHPLYTVTWNFLPARLLRSRVRPI